MDFIMDCAFIMTLFRWRGQETNEHTNKNMTSRVDCYCRLYTILYILYSTNQGAQPFKCVISDSALCRRGACQQSGRDCSHLSARRNAPGRAYKHIEFVFRALCSDVRSRMECTWCHCAGQIMPASNRTHEHSYRDKGSRKTGCIRNKCQGFNMSWYWSKECIFQECERLRHVCRNYSCVDSRISLHALRLSSDVLAARWECTCVWSPLAVPRS